MGNIKFSVIIPHRDSVEMLHTLLESIPQSDDIEILIVDNSPQKLLKNDIITTRAFKLYYSSPDRGAGGARNKGIEHATGKWLIFSDADDFFSSNAFDVFNSKVDSNADVIYTCMDGIYIDTKERSNRGVAYSNLVKNFLLGKIPETDLRFNYSSPCGKMIRHEMVKDKNLRFDEVVASNDVYFSMLVGFYSKSIEAVDEVTYIITTSKGSLTQRRDYSVIKARFDVNLRYNKFMKIHGYSKYQRSILYYAVILIKLNFRNLFYCIAEVIKYHQNPFVGVSHWIFGLKNVIKTYSKDNRYIVR